MLSTSDLMFGIRTTVNSQIKYRDVFIRGFITETVTPVFAFVFCIHWCSFLQKFRFRQWSMQRLDHFRKRRLVCVLFLQLACARYDLVPAILVKANRYHVVFISVCKVFAFLCKWINSQRLISYYFESNMPEIWIKCLFHVH